MDVIIFPLLLILLAILSLRYGADSRHLSGRNWW
jgi:hypothetical protein